MVSPTLSSVIVTLLFLALAGFAAWRCRGKPPFPIGVAVLATCVITNICAYTLSIGWRPIVYPVLATAIALTAAHVIVVERSFKPAPMIWLSLVIPLLTFGYAMKASPVYGDLYTLVLGTNIVFVLMCGLLLWWGRKHALVWPHNFRLFDRGDRRAPQLGAHRTHKEP